MTCYGSVQAQELHLPRNLALNVPRQGYFHPQRRMTWTCPPGKWNVSTKTFTALSEEPPASRKAMPLVFGCSVLLSNKYRDRITTVSLTFVVLMAQQGCPWLPLLPWRV